MNSKILNTKSLINVEFYNLTGIPLSTLVSWLFMFSSTPALELNGLGYKLAY